jgi:hypothetical protein
MIIPRQNGRVEQRLVWVAFQLLGRSCETNFIIGVDTKLKNTLLVPENFQTTQQA